MHFNKYKITFLTVKNILDNFHCMMAGILIITSETQLVIKTLAKPIHSFIGSQDINNSSLL